MRLDKLFSYPGVSDYTPDMLFLNGFATVFSSEFFLDNEDAPSSGFSIDVAGNIGSNTSTSGSLLLNIGLDGYSNSSTISQLTLDGAIVGSSVFLTGVSNALTYAFGDIYRSYSMSGNSFSNSYLVGQANINLGFVSESNSRTSLSGQTRINLGLISESNSRTSLSGQSRTNLGFIAESNSRTSASGQARNNLGFVAESNSRTLASGQTRNNLGFVAESNSRTFASGNSRTNLGFYGNINATTSESLNIEISRALSALSQSVTSAECSINLEGVVTLAGIIASNTSSNAALDTLLLLNATIQSATILQNAGVNVNRMFEAISSSTTRTVGDIQRQISLGGNIDSVTSALGQAQVNILLSGISSAISQLRSGTLDTIGQVALEGVINALSQVTGQVSINLSFGATVLSSTSSVGNLDISQAILLTIQDAITGHSSSSGAIIKTVSLDSESSTDTEIRGSINLDVSLGSIVGVLSSLNGTLEGEVVVGTGKIIRLSVYLMMNHELSLDIQRSYDDSVSIAGIC